MNNDLTKVNWKGLIKDLVVISIISIFVFVLSSIFEVFEKIEEWSEKYEKWQIDEFFVVFTFLAFVLLVFTWRRWKELRYELSKRMRAEEALRESEEKYRNLVERANDGITIIQDSIIIYANRRIAEIWGGTVEEIVGKAFMNYVHPDELPTVVDRYKRRMAGEDVPQMYETVLRRKDDSKIYAELNVALITLQGSLAELVIVRDITERKYTEEEKEKLIQQLQDALAKVKQLSGLLPICMLCKKIRDDKGYWNQIEAYISEHSEAEFSHGMCPDCMKKTYSDYYKHKPDKE